MMAPEAAVAIRAKLTFVVCPPVMVTVLLKLLKPLADADICTLPIGKSESMKFPVASVAVVRDPEETLAPEIPFPSDARVTRPAAVPVVGAGAFTTRLTCVECCSPPPTPMIVTV